MSDIQSWTSEGMAWTDLPRRPLWPYAEALRLATLERLALVQLAPPPVLAPSLSPNQPPTHDWANAIDASIEALVPRFLNHLAPAPQPWSLPDILQALGTDQRLQATAATPFRSAWLAQTHDLLNLLLWTEVTAVQDASWDIRTGQADTWAGAQSAFHAAAWQMDVPDGSPPLHEARHAAGTFTIERRRGHYTFGPLPAGTRDIDVRARFGSRGGGYLNHDYSSPEGVVSLIIHETAHTGSTYAVTLGDLETITVTEAAQDEGHGWQASSITLLLKHNVTGGLMFA